MATIEEIVSLLDTLDPQNLGFVADFVRYLQWKQGAASPAAGGRPWAFDFVEHFRRAMVGADADPAGMEVRVGEATCGGETRMALWQHPPVQGAAFVEYQVPVPAGVNGLRLRFATGIRDGSHLAKGNVVAFRVFVNDWKIWSDTQHARRWKEYEIAMPTLPGDVARIRFVTDGLGNHEWAWAVWGEPRLVGYIAD
ncbi:MAG TPA: hypothetical protein ENJ31_10440 [Anaerolineae bacterium]|nr:hypothetical protein [Anaerolineae bacterium]